MMYRDVCIALPPICIIEERFRRLVVKSGILIRSKHLSFFLLCVVFSKKQRASVKSLLFSIACMLLIHTGCFSQDTFTKYSDSNRVFSLGEVVVSAQQTNPVFNEVTSTRIQTFAKTDVGKALNLLPGVNLSAVGPRNESMVFIRGFDLRQVPVLLDGIPVYVPYDGYVDLARFTTFDLSKIQVSKDYTSVTYGPNAMGGAINLISQRPLKKIEINGASGWQTGGFRTNVNVGSNQGKFYVQAGFSKFKRSYFKLSNDFQKMKNEDGGRRDNSYNDDQKVNIKIAFTPNIKSEYALSYSYQQGEKGNPVYAGSDTLNSQLKNPRYWQWPKWNKQSIYFLSNTSLSTSQYLKTRLYYDQFINLLNSYDDNTFSTMAKGYAFKSFYNDYTLGAIVEYGKKISHKDKLVLNAQYKADIHREHNEGEPERTMSDGTFTLAMENRLVLTPSLSFLTGISYNKRLSTQAQNYNSSTDEITDYPSNQNDAFNIQGGIQYVPAKNNMFNLSVARKTRFATTKDRYSYRMGTAIPNPYLAAEYTVNYNLSYKASFLQNRLQSEAAIFYSHIGNTILMVDNVATDPENGRSLSQLQNIGKSEYEGAELGLQYRFIQTLSAGMNYTYIKRTNITNPDIYFTDVPTHKLFGFVQYEFRKVFFFQVNSEYNADRYSTSYGTVSKNFIVWNTSATSHLYKWFSLEAGVNNILDKNYTLVEGYPEPGRNYFINLIYRL